MDFERGTINLRIDDSQTRKGRAMVPMNASTRAALDVAQRAALSDFVVEYVGKQVGSSRKGVQGAIARSGIGNVRIHDLRHTAAVTMPASGVPLEKGVPRSRPQQPGGDLLDLWPVPSGAHARCGECARLHEPESES
ncbi:hypothetical protein [Pseudooceanicola sp.]|uniref:hypothetical protein n=1 Tax=Pseudooceanicola sp. TaxID=1914328 RepID=UPI0040598935